jgi:hypothetical protein
VGSRSITPPFFLLFLTHFAKRYDIPPAARIDFFPHVAEVARLWIVQFDWLPCQLAWLEASLAARKNLPPSLYLFSPLRRLRLRQRSGEKRGFG